MPAEAAPPEPGATVEDVEVEVEVDDGETDCGETDGDVPIADVTTADAADLEIPDSDLVVDESGSDAADAGGEPDVAPQAGAADGTETEATEGPEAEAEESDEDEDVYEAERIVKEREAESGGVEYFVKWRGWAHKFNTWEPAAHILDGGLIAEYEAIKRAREERKAKAAEYQREVDTINNNIMTGAGKRKRAEPVDPEVSAKLVCLSGIWGWEV